MDKIKSKENMKPFIKWAGGKSQLLGEINKKIPNDFGISLKKYAEPFVGGGALLFYILSNFEVDEIFISDINAELINTYNVIKYEIDKIIECLYVLQKEYLVLNDDEKKIFYYDKRKLFNQIKNNTLVNDIEKASLFIFLNKTCFNGLYRVNKNNEFNVPVGKYKNPLICDEDNLRKISQALKNVIIKCCDYRETASFIDNNTLVYIDPPYRPLTKTSNFISYNNFQFNDQEQKNLVCFINEMSKKGAKIIVSNSDPKNINVDDDFFDNLYKKNHITRIKANRMINSKGKLRGKISEILITNFKEKIL